MPKIKCKNAERSESLEISTDGPFVADDIIKLNNNYIDDYRNGLKFEPPPDDIEQIVKIPQHSKFADLNIIGNHFYQKIEDECGMYSSDENSITSQINCQDNQ